jgi:hypothetical protein
VILKRSSSGSPKSGLSEAAVSVNMFKDSLGYSLLKDIGVFENGVKANY